MRYFAFIMGAGLLAGLVFFQLYRQAPAAAGQPAPRAQAPLAGADCAAVREGLARVVCLAEAFKATLTPDQLAAVQRPYSKADAARWSNFPQQFSRPPRVGLRLGDLTPPQRAAAQALLQAVLRPGVPNEGYDELQGIRATDDYLGAATKKTDTFGGGNYYLAFLGVPSLSGRWELQGGGHHYALANTYAGGQVAGLTPAFRGAEPMSAVPAAGRTYQPMAQEQRALAALLGSLSAQQRAAAQLPATFTDVLLGPGRDGQFPATRQGLRLGGLPASQQQLALTALGLYVNDLTPATADPVLAGYRAQLAATYLAFAGSGTLRQAGDYVRLDGPRLWLEYSAQPSRDFPGTVHAHSVWRDRTSDYGGQD